MSKREVRLILLDMVEAIAKVERYTAGLDFQSFATDELRVDAVIRNLEVIGEASRQVPDSLCLCSGGIDWRRVVGFRNIVIHKYFDVDLEIVWVIINEDLPSLKRVLQAMLTTWSRRNYAVARAGPSATPGTVKFGDGTTVDLQSAPRRTRNARQDSGIPVLIRRRES